MIPPVSSVEMIGQSERLRSALTEADRFATSTLPILITGENGTGKELLAARIHNRSGRRGELIAVNCGAIPEQLMESTFFGHAKGAFTGATMASCGLIKRAEGGTFFLDEIGELTLQMQVKLLRVLESHEVLAVGALRAEKVDVRILAATNRDLWSMVEDGRFREDLYWRVKGVQVELPPLRARGDDVVLLAQHFLTLTPYSHTVTKISPAAANRLRAQVWTGNIRQLRSEIMVAAIVAHAVLSTSIEPQHFPMERTTPTRVKTNSVVSKVESEEELTAAASTLPPLPSMDLEFTPDPPAGSWPKIADFDAEIKCQHADTTVITMSVSESDILSTPILTPTARILESLPPCHDSSIEGEATVDITCVHDLAGVLTDAETTFVSEMPDNIDRNIDASSSSLNQTSNQSPPWTLNESTLVEAPIFEYAAETNMDNTVVSNAGVSDSEIQSDSDAPAERDGVPFDPIVPILWWRRKLGKAYVLACAGLSVVHSPSGRYATIVAPHSATEFVVQPLWRGGTAEVWHASDTKLSDKNDVIPELAPMDVVTQWNVRYARSRQCAL